MQMASHDPDQLPLQGVVLCCTSLPQHERTSLASNATELGAQFQLDLTSHVTHLIVGCITTPKYRYVAKERPDIKVVRREWLEAVRQGWMGGGDVNVQELEGQHRLPTFFDLKICITGWEDLDKRAALSESVKQNGGEYHPDLTKAVTHLIAKTTTGAKYTHAKEWGIRIVSAKWYEESLRRGMALDETLYDPAVDEREQGLGAFRLRPKPRPTSGKRVRDGDSQSTEDSSKRKMRRTASVRLHSQSQDMWSGMTAGESVPQRSEIDQWMDGNPSESLEQSVQPERPSLEKLQVRRSEVLQLQQPEEQEPQGLFAGRWIIISGFPRDKVTRLKEFLEPNGATVVRSIRELEDAPSDPSFVSRLLLVPRLLEEGPLDLPDVPPGTDMVTEWWLERCIHYKRFFEPAVDVLSRPFWDVNVLAGVTVCSSGFSGLDFRQTAEVVKLIGATFDERLSTHVSVLISGSENVRKEKAYYADKHGIPVVSAEWLWRCLETKQRPPYEDFKINLPANDPAHHARSSGGSPAPSILASMTRVGDGKAKREHSPPKRLSSFRRNHPATPTLPLQTVRLKPSSSNSRRPGPFILEDFEENEISAPAPDDEAQVPAAAADEHKAGSKSQDKAHPVLQELSPNLSPDKVSQSKHDLDQLDGQGNDEVDERVAAPLSPKNRQRSPQSEPVPPSARPQEQLTASLASLLQQQKAARSDSLGSESRQRRKSRPLGRSASGIGNRSASASLYSEHPASPSVPEVSESLADGFSFAKETPPPPPPGTQLGYETMDAETHRSAMEKRMKVKLQDESTGKRVASVGMVKDSVDNSGVGNRVRGRHRTK